MKNGEDVFDDLDRCGGLGCGPAAHDLVYGGGEQFCRCACKEVTNQSIILNYLTEISTWGKALLTSAALSLKLVTTRGSTFVSVLSKDQILAIVRKCQR